MTILDQPSPSDARSVTCPRDSGECQVPLRSGRAVGVYRRRHRWAITWGGVSASEGEAELALSAYLDVLRARRLRPLFVGVPDPIPYARRGLYTHRYAQEAVLDLVGFDLAAPERVELRGDIEVLAQAGLVVLPYRPVHAAAVAGFAPVAELLRGDPAGIETWVAVDRAGAVRGIAAWQRGPASAADTGAPRVLRLAAVHPQASASVVELLIADAVVEYRERGVAALHLGWQAEAPWWPVPGSTTTRGLRRGVKRSAPRWRPRWLALLSGWQLPAAAWALR